MTDKIQAKAIAHLHSGGTKEMEIGGPPFPPILKGEVFGLPREKLVFTFYHRAGQDPTSLEQHYYLDDGLGMREVITEADLDDDTGYGENSYFTRAMAKDD